MGLLFKCGYLSVFGYPALIKRLHLKKYCFFYSLEFIQPFTTRTFYKMKSAYFQREENIVCINLNYNENNMNRILKFQRPILEDMDTFLRRVQLRLQAVVSKKIKRKQKDVKTFIVSEANVSLFLNNEPVPGELKFQDIFQDDLSGNLRLRINEDDYAVFLNAPMVLKMVLPATMYAGTVAFPESLQTQYMDEERSEYVWYKNQQPFKAKNWQKCGEGFFYFIKDNDIDFHLKVVCTPKMNEKVGPLFEVASVKKVVEFKALKEILKRHEFTKEATKVDEFRIVSYNILAFTYTQTKEAKTELFTFCDPSFLDFSYRKSLCISELLGYKADIMCLQEVDKFHYSTLELLFSKRGYGCFFHEKEGSREGCSLIYNKNKFNVSSVNQYVLSKELFNNILLEDIKLKIKRNENLIARLQGIPTILQVIVLETSSKDTLIVGNTHFYFHPDADHIRLLQGVMSWKILQSIYEERKEKNKAKKCSIILCGDLNSTPECGFHQFLNTGSLDSDHFSWRGKEDEAVTDISCQHPLKMKSAYDNTQYTNYTPVFKGCLDYIYYQTDHLKLIKTVPIPNEDVLSCSAGIPSQFFPSDHVALVADFIFVE